MLTGILKRAKSLPNAIKLVRWYNDLSHVKRGSYATLSDEHVTRFERIVGPTGLLTIEEDVAPYNVDWLKLREGKSRLVLRPKTTEEVSDIVKLCFEENLAVCPQGGNTGVVGGSTPVFDEIILSTSLMNQIEKIDEITGTVQCQAGCVLKKVNDKLASHSLMLPHDLGAKGSCQIGGNISTCAGGLRLLRYGSMQANVLGLEVVLSDGTILNCLNHLKKDNTGYHLRQCFIGSEGTLGIVTRAVMACPPVPRAVNLAFLGLDSFSDVLNTLKLVRTRLQEIVSACEMMDEESMGLVVKNLQLQNPLIDERSFYMIVETNGSNVDHDREKMTNFVDEAMSKGFVKDGVLTDETSRIQSLWAIRERMPEAFVKSRSFIAYDITLPLTNQYYDIVNIMRDRLLGDTEIDSVSGISHLGDGNLHLNILAPPQGAHSKTIDKIEPFIYEYVQKHNGSISAEHGIGTTKSPFLKYSKSPEAIALMKQLKTTFDPKGILNPYKIISDV